MRALSKPAVVALFGILGAAFGLPAHSQIPVNADALSKICKAGESEKGPIVWYESSLPAQADKIITAFRAQFPALQVQHVRSSGGQAIPAMIIQESRAKVRTADVASGTYDQGKLLNGRGLLAQMTAAELGIVDKQLLPVPYGIVTANTFTAVVYNKNMVPASEVPTKWNDLAAAKWKGKMGIFLRGGQFFADWAAVWGEEGADSLAKAIAAQNPVLAESTFTLAQDIAAGARPIGVGLYHTAAQVQETGAPIAIEVLQPVAVMPLATYVMKDSPNPSAARCFATWLVSPEGALAYENATLRGNHLVKSTKTYKLLEGKELAGWDFDKIEEFARLTAKYNALLSNR